MRASDGFPAQTPAPVSSAARSTESPARPEVSVIIPTHNRPKFLKSAIQSVLNQTYRNFELIVVDDAADEDTAEVVRAFSDQRIRYYRHDRAKGGAAARNTGILQSKSDYLAFLDDDDEWLPTKLARQMDVLGPSGPEVGAIYTGRVTVHTASGKIVDEHRPTRRGRLEQDLLVENCIGGASSVVVKRSCLDKVGMFDETLPCSQDYDLWLRIAKDYLIECVEEPLFNYHVHNNQITNDLDALSKGLELIVKKYCTFSVRKKYYSDRYVDLGVRRCLIGDTRGGRSDFLKGLSLAPLQIRGYLNLCLTFAGAGNFKRVKNARRRITELLSGRSESS